MDDINGVVNVLPKTLPSKSAHKGRIGNMKGMRALTEDEINLVCKSFAGPTKYRDLALFELGIRAGFRVSEMLSLRIKDVYQHGKIVDEVYVQRRNMKKKIEGRCAPLHEKAKEAIGAWVKELLTSGGWYPDMMLFRSRVGSNKAISRVMAWKILTEAYQTNGLGMGIGCHGLRKSYARKVFKQLDYNLVDTQLAMGHKDISSTIKYLASNNDKVKAAILAD